ncbi:hypothetical protein M422DRAFT_68755 [Sphaerobolus stellatus SS14]|uniref:Unplaced genomic scaffold SPHSTscaffold_75, whole genome shotgun sequence n=1 Tax=Sphaerobolus stellatus (strain SS14) TaxID=990650 RepID=A0A0C9UXM4_SPHS4|nr:hypothetical protein M422DRAFT_68755 [Sphaerobolus stellatus SS14]
MTTAVKISQKRLSALRKVDALLKLLRVIITGVLATLTYPLASSSVKQPSLLRELVRRVIKTLVGKCDALQVQYLQPGGSQVYKTWMATEARKHNLPTEPCTELLGDGGKLYWVGRKDAKKLILHFHSGGCALPLNPGHFNLNNYFREEVLRRNQVDVKMAFLEYSQYGLVDLDNSSASFTENTHKDIIDADSLIGWAELIKQGTMQDGRTPESERNWLEAAKAPPKWWKGTSKISKNFIVLYGEREVLKDEIVTFVERFKEGVEPEGVEMRVIQQKDGIHVGPTTEAGRGFPPRDEVKALAGWVHERIMEV